MAWTAPKRYSFNTATVVADFNTYVRDNLNEMSPAKITAKGDIIGGTAANAVDDENIGTAGQFLTADSTSARGFSAQTHGMGKNRCLWIQPAWHMLGDATAFEGGDATGSTYAAWNVGTNTTEGNVFCNIRIPPDFSSMNSVTGMFKGENANLYWEFNTQWGQIEVEDEDFSNDSIAVASISSGWTASDLEAVDLSAAFTGVAAGDQIGMRLKRDGDNASDNGSGGVIFYGIMIEYTAT